MKKRNIFIRFCTISFLAAAVFLMVSCKKEETKEPEKEEINTAVEEVSELTLNKNGVMLKAGESFQLETAAGTAAAYKMCIRDRR